MCLNGGLRAPIERRISMSQFQEWPDQSMNLRKIAKVLSIFSLVLVLLSFLFATAAFASDANALASAFATTIFFWIPAVLLLLIALLFYLVSKVGVSDEKTH
jgi:uncharacterized Tic20 family protein